MNITKIFPTIILSTFWAISQPSAQAIQLANGTVYFDKAPDLVSVTTTFNNVEIWGATYLFTISLPANAGVPLQRLNIAQIEGLDSIRYNLNETYAFEGDRQHQGKQVKLGKVKEDQKTRTISIIFDPPILPGKTITLALLPVNNPIFDGVYLFGVTAFPEGEKAYGLYLGVGRLHFYRRP